MRRARQGRALHADKEGTTGLRISVSGYLKFRGFFGDGMSVDLPADDTTLRHALEVICEQCGETLRDALYDPATQELKRSNLILVNGQPHTNLGERLDSMLKDGDKVALCTFISGG